MRWRNRRVKGVHPDVCRQKQVSQLRLWSPVASVDAYGKVVCYDGLIAENVKHGS